MSDQFFWWTGAIVIALLAASAFAYCIIWLYANFIHERIGHILFRKTERRISIASWYNARLMSDEFYKADDWPICERPLYLSYELPSHRRLFIMIGKLEPRRDAPIQGTHPEFQP
ncbi:hypothetical protein M2336_001680 [Sphingobium sp. B1D7B]|uniref:hypothetical protein n=1 Tax=Sphingobium sp. B1D7B TaxID=2940578 RepID=UPI0022244E02|nr:hypothetical protein [Sphingobium sp. B1D7B]MCW2405051.1 hypothetical protein [Sphingobium sp. B1D7B]